MLFLSHQSNLAHDMGPGSYEDPARLAAILAAVGTPEFAFLDRRQAPAATPEQLARVHTPAYLEKMLTLADTAVPAMLDADTIAAPGSITAALHAAGALVAAVDAVLQGEHKTAFCAVRPPGHHAEPGQAMGFCFFNNCAIGAAHALARHAVRRVAVIDCDVHHGNGTQSWAAAEPRAFFASTHQMPLYPGTGLPLETGPHNNCLNIPLAAGTGGAELRSAFQWHILPRLDAFAPDLIFLSAGFDAHRADPLGGLCWTESDYDWLTRELVARAGQLCQGRMISTLEGGYDHAALAASVCAHIRALASQPGGA